MVALKSQASKATTVSLNIKDIRFFFRFVLFFSSYNSINISHHSQQLKVLIAKRVNSGFFAACVFEAGIAWATVISSTIFEAFLFLSHDNDESCG